MQPILNPPDDVSALQSLSMEARISVQCDDEEPESFTLHRNVVFRFGAWESELIWQTFQAIANKHGGYTEALEALEEVSRKLKPLR